MRRFVFADLLLFALLLYMVGGCDLFLDGKGNVSDAAPQGTWVWKSSTGGFAGRTMTPASEGYTQRLVLDDDGDFAFYRGQARLSSGRYAVEQEGTSILLRYAPPAGPLYEAQRVERPDADRLVLHDTCMDCFTHTFVRSR